MRDSDLYARQLPIVENLGQEGVRLAFQRILTIGIAPRLQEAKDELVKAFKLPWNAQAMTDAMCRVETSHLIFDEEGMLVQNLGIELSERYYSQEIARDLVPISTDGYPLFVYSEVQEHRTRDVTKLLQVLRHYHFSVMWGEYAEPLLREDAYAGYGLDTVRMAQEWEAYFINQEKMRLDRRIYDNDDLPPAPYWVTAQVGQQWYAVPALSGSEMGKIENMMSYLSDIVPRTLKTRQTFNGARLDLGRPHELRLEWRYHALNLNPPYWLIYQSDKETT